MAELFVNDVQSVLANAIGASDLTLTVASATGFPGTGNFRIRIDNEIMLVTGVSGTTFTVTRAVEPVSGIQVADSHHKASSVVQVLTAGSLGTIGGSPSGPAGGDLTGTYPNPTLNVPLLLTETMLTTVYVANLIDTDHFASGYFETTVSGVIFGVRLAPVTSAAEFSDNNTATVLCNNSAAALFVDASHEVLICDGTNNITYTPATPGNWQSPAPTDLWLAVDRLAAACVAAGHTP